MVVRLTSIRPSEDDLHTVGIALNLYFSVLRKVKPDWYIHVISTSALNQSGLIFKSTTGTLLAISRVILGVPVVLLEN